MTITRLVAAADWTAPNVIQSLVAGGTLLMAIVTALAVRASNRVAGQTERLAGETEKLAAETKRSVDLAARELELVERQVTLGTDQLEAARRGLLTSNRPLLVNVPVGVYQDVLKHDVRQDRGTVSGFHREDFASIAIPVRNIGNGPAVIADAIVEAPGQRTRCLPSNMIIAPGELSDFTFHLDYRPLIEDPLSFVGAWVRLIVSYSDSASAQALQTTLYAPFGEHKYRVRSVILAEQDSTGVYKEMVTAQV